MKVMKQVLVVALIVIASFTVKLDVQADSYTYWDGSGWSTDSSEMYTSNPIEISYPVTYDYEEAYKMLEYVNAERRKVGAPDLIMKDELMDVAMQRAAETVIYWEHIRPDGSSIQSLSYYIFGENLHRGAGTAEGANYSLAHSNGHYENMIDSQWKYAGFGCVKSNEKYFWVQVFSVEEVYHENGFDLYNPENNKPVEWDKMGCYDRTNCSKMFTAKINPKMYDSITCKIVSSETSEDEYCVGEYIDFQVLLNYTTRQGKGKNPSHIVDASEYVVSLKGSKLKSTDKGIQCMDAGTVKVTVFLKDYPQLKVTKEIKIKVKKGSIVTRKGCEYKVTDKSKKTVSLIKGANKKKVAVPKTIKIDGKKYKVTKIANQAFKGMTKVTEVTISENVTSIGKEAFANCSNLKKITVKSTKLKSVGKNAFKGISKKATIKVPKSKLKKYKTLFKGKGQSKKVKIKK